MSRTSLVFKMWRLVMPFLRSYKHDSFSSPQMRRATDLPLMACRSQFLIAILPLIAIFSHLPLLAVADYVLYTGEVLMAGQNLTNSQYRLSMQSNCDLVLYDDGDSPLWRTNTSGRGHDCYLGMKQTGELVVRQGLHYTLWSSSSRKSRRGKYAMVLDGNGNIGVYGQRRWASSNQREEPKQGKPVISADYVLYSGERLMASRKLKYNNFELSLTRCNMEIRNLQTEKTLWQTNTQQSNDGKRGNCYVELGADGELSVRHSDERLWSSNKKYDSGEYIAVLRFDGRLNIYGPLIWSNNWGNDDSILTA